LFVRWEAGTVFPGVLAMVLLMAERTKKQRSVPQRDTTPAS